MKVKVLGVKVKVLGVKVKVLGVKVKVLGVKVKVLGVELKVLGVELKVLGVELKAVEEYPSKALIIQPSIITKKQMLMKVMLAQTASVANISLNGTRTNTSNSTESNSSSKEGAVLTGIIVGSVLLLTFILFMLICLTNKFHTRRKRLELDKNLGRRRTKESVGTSVDRGRKLIPTEGGKKEDLNKIREGEKNETKVNEQVVNIEGKKIADGGFVGSKKLHDGMDGTKPSQNEMKAKKGDGGGSSETNWNAVRNGNGVQESLTNSSSTNKVPGMVSTRHLTSRPIKSSRVSPSQLYVPQSSDSKQFEDSPSSKTTNQATKNAGQAGKTKSPFSVISSTTSSGPHAGSETAASLFKMTPVNNNINADESSRHKYVKVSQALYEPVSQALYEPVSGEGEKSESNNAGKNTNLRNETQKPTLSNDDRNDDYTNDDDDDHNAEKMSITENGEKGGKNSVSNFSAPTATLTTEKMKEMMKQMNLEVGNSSIIGNSTSDIKKEKEGRAGIKKKEDDDVRMKKNRKEKEGLVNKNKGSGRRKGRKYKKKKHGSRHEKEGERIE